MLLGKLGWKLFAEPLSLVIRILKARVFSIRDFLNANIRHSLVMFDKIFLAPRN
jgi:hypothetical protein